MKNIAQAISDFNAECPPIPKDQTAHGEKFSFDYASFESIVTIVAPTMRKNDLYFIQIPDDEYLLTTVIHFESGEQISGKIKIKYQENNAQKFGAGLSFARRQALCTMLNLTPEEKANKKPENKKPWLNPDTKKWDEAVTWMASAPDGSLENLRKKYRISQKNASRLVEEANAWSNGSK